MDGLDATRCAEAQVVGPERSAGQSQAQSHRRCHLQEGLAPCGCGGVIRIHSQVVGFIRDGQHPLRRPGLQGFPQHLWLTPSALVGQQKAVGQSGVLTATGPWHQGQVEPCRRFLPLLEDRGAVAEHQKPLQLLFPLHRLKRQQRSQRFAGTRPCEHQEIVVRFRFTIKATSQQLDQLLLPLPWSDHRCRSWIPDVKTEGRDGGCGKDESF